MDYKTFINKKDSHHKTDGYIYPFFEKEDENSMIKIICPIHGEFIQNIYAHLKGQGCPKCAKNQKWDTEKYVSALNEKFGEGRYDTSDCVYVNKRTRVTLYCHEKFADGTEHGKMEVLPLKFLESKNGCRYCAMNIQNPSQANKGQKELKCTPKNLEKEKQLIDKYKTQFNNFYTYEKFKYRGTLIKSTITCPIHGDFDMTPNNHSKGHGCPKCAGNAKIELDEFKKRSSEIHNFKYDYSKVKQFHNSDSIVTIICPEHGEFNISISNHLRGVGCSLCSNNHKLTNETFIKKANTIHNNKYDYSKINYINSSTKVVIVCPEHGEFTIQPQAHIQGQGCPKCNQSHLERIIASFLKEKNIIFEEQKHFMWLGKQTLDFYIPKLNIGIECQGLQHFKPIEQFGGENTFKQILMRDIKKYNTCIKNGVNIIYFWNYQYEDYSDPIYNSIYTNNNIYTNLKDLETFIINHLRT